jgi:hypothetical protein
MGEMDRLVSSSVAVRNHARWRPCLSTLAWVVGAACALSLTSCADYADSQVGVSIVNDLDRPVAALQCGNGCNSQGITEKDTLAPGASVSTNVEIGVSTPWLVVNSTGRPIGWLLLFVGSRPDHDPRGKVSSVLPARKCV